MNIRKILDSTKPSDIFDLSNWKVQYQSWIKAVHPDHNTSVGAREAFEKLMQYKEILENGLTEHEFDHVFLGYYDSLPLINPDEVMNYRYLSFDAIKAEIESNPGNYTVWFRKIFEQVNEHILNRLQ